MDRATVEVYDDRGLAWAASHGTPERRADAGRFAARVVPGLPGIDLGCGAGRYTRLLGEPVIGFDASKVMLEACRSAAPRAHPVRGDIEALPFARGSLGGAWSWMTHHHVPRDRLPMALWDLHRSLAVGAPFELQVLSGDHDGEGLPGDTVGGRYFAAWQADQLVDVVVGAGFDVDAASVVVDGDELRLRAERARTLADTVGPRMRLLVCGLNPSIYAADAGIGFARPGNRFWPAALAAGLVTRGHDPVHAFTAHRVGMTDQVKRATRAADELTGNEFREGLRRVERMVRWLRPLSICFVGLAGWRAVAGPRAVAGVQPGTLGGRPVYVMPSTSGLNARTSLDQLVDHVRAAMALADRS